MRHGGGVDVAAARVLDRDGEREVDGDVPQQRRRADAADARDLDRHAVRDAVALRGQQRRQRVDALVEYERVRAVGAHRAAVLVRHARLLDRDLEVARVAQERARLPGRPGAVGVAEDHDVGCDRRAHGVHSLDILRRIGADLDLDAPVAGSDVRGRAPRHDVGRRLRDRAVELDGGAIAAAQVRAQRYAGRLAARS